MSTHLARSLLVGAMLAGLLTGCAAPSPAVAPEAPVSVPEPAPSETTTPEIELLEPGTQVVPASCDELIPASQARLDLEFEERDSLSIDAVIGVTAGLLACQRGTMPPGFAASVYVLAVPPPGWDARLREAGATETNGVLLQKGCVEGVSFCIARLATDSYAAELFVTDYGKTGTIESEMDAIASELGVTLGSLPEPGARPLPSEQPLHMPLDCAAIDISESSVASEVASILANREPFPGSDDGPSLYYAAETRVAAVWCVWREGYDDIEFHLVPGGGWAVDGSGPTTPGAALDVEGADAARWADSPLEEETVVVTARIGDDLAMLTLTDASFDGAIAEDRVDLADRVLEAFLGSLLNASR